MSEALQTISEEHRIMWRLMTALEGLRATLDDPAEKPDIELFSLILDYMERCIEQSHEPKEEGFLYRTIRERTDEANELIDEFLADHASGPGLLATLRGHQRHLADHYPEGIAEFQTSLDDYVRMIRRHIMREETLLFPIARKALDDVDWDEINAAFVGTEGESEAVRAEFRALMSRIVNLAPAPIGLGLEQAPEPAPAPAEGAPMLEICGLTSHYGRIQALRGVDLTVKRGQLVALVGANGAGKTTLLRTISGVQKVTGGSIAFAGEDITRLRADKRVRLGIGQVPEGRQVFGPLSVEDNLRLGAYTRCDKAAIAEDIERMYTMFPILKQKAKQAAGTLSGGQQQMLAMARALMARPKLLLLDEPSMGLAPLLVEEIFNAIIDLRRQAMTIFLVEQNAHAALAIADHAYVIETGEVVLSGSGRELLSNERVKAAYLGL